MTRATSRVKQLGNSVGDRDGQFACLHIESLKFFAQSLKTFFKLQVADLLTRSNADIPASSVRLSDFMITRPIILVNTSNRNARDDKRMQ